jgi:hypothetical protein
VWRKQEGMGMGGAGWGGQREGGCAKTCSVQCQMPMRSSQAGLVLSSGVLGSLR